MLQHVSERSFSGLILPFVKQPRSGIPMPAIWIFQSCDEFCGGSFAEARLFGPLEAIRNNSINPAAIVAAVEVEEFFDVIGE